MMIPTPMLGGISLALVLGWPPDGGWVSTVAFTPDGQCMVATGGGGAPTVWEAATGAPGVTLQGEPGAATAAAFGPAGDRVVAGIWRGSLHVWDAEDGEMLLALDGHAENVTAVAVSPDGKRFASSSGDGHPGSLEPCGHPHRRAQPAPGPGQPAPPGDREIDR